MQFQVPQFIEKETGFLGPLTPRQTVIFFFAIGICVFLWITLGSKNLFLFTIAAITVMAGALALGFMKVNGLNVTTVLKNCLNFTAAPKLYLWKRKEATIYYEKRPQPAARKEPEKDSPLKIAKISKIKDLSKKIEFGN